MNTPMRPLVQSVSPAPLAPTTLRQPEQTTPAAIVPAATRPRPTESEADDDSRRDFYAWCAGCEGYGSIF